MCVTACPLVKPAVSQLVKEFSAFRGTRRFITVFARSQNCEKRILGRAHIEMQATQPMQGRAAQVSVIHTLNMSARVER